MLAQFRNSQIFSSQWSVKAIDTVTNTFNQAQGYLENSWQTATQATNHASGVIENTVNAYIQNISTQNYKFVQFLQTLNWAVNHPIISAIILLFVIACVGGILKRLFFFIETASWSILKIPLKLLQLLIQSIFRSVTKLMPGNWLKNTNINKNNHLFVQDKQIRLAEIYHRLEIIQKEQQQLLQEAANLIDSETGGSQVKSQKSKSQNSKVLPLDKFRGLNKE